MEYETINWDDRWAQLVELYHRERWPGWRGEVLYRQYYVDTADCSFHVERIFERLAEFEAQYEFAAHTDPHAFPPNAMWRMLVRHPSGAPVSAHCAVRDEVWRIRKSVEAEFAAIGRLTQQLATDEQMRQIAEEGAKWGLRFDFPYLRRRQ